MGQARLSAASTLTLLTLTAPTVSIGGDLTVSRIGYGGMALTGLGGWGEPEDPQAARNVLRRALELGVQLFDTADSYGPHVSEEAIASALFPYSAGVVLATKAGSVREGPWQMRADGSPTHLRSACEGSLLRLRREQIDLFQLHTIDPNVPLEESLGALSELRAEGKIRHIGLSNVRVAQIQQARRVVPIVSVQNQYSLAVRGEEDPVIDYCEHEGIAYLAWHPLAKGSLARRHGALGRVAERHGTSPARVALAWLLARSPAIIPIPGTLSLAHLEENTGALLLELSAADVEELSSYQLSRLDARSVARRFVPPRLRRVAVRALGIRRRLSR